MSYRKYHRKAASGCPKQFCCVQVDVPETDKTTFWSALTDAKGTMHGSTLQSIAEVKQNRFLNRIQRTRRTELFLNQKDECLLKARRSSILLGGAELLTLTDKVKSVVSRATVPYIHI